MCTGLKFVRAIWSEIITVDLSELLNHQPVNSVPWGILTTALFRFLSYGSTLTFFGLRKGWSYRGHLLWDPLSKPPHRTRVSRRVPPAFSRDVYFRMTTKWRVLRRCFSQEGFLEREESADRKAHCGCALETKNALKRILTFSTNFSSNNLFNGIRKCSNFRKK